jgi:imidazolonepropionase
MIIHSASQLLTIRGSAQRGNLLGELKIIENGAVLFQNGIIKQVGSTQELLSSHPDEEAIDASGKVVMPGFVDPHTHAIWAGNRANEFEQRLAGKSYMQIMESGGGIMSTVNATRDADIERLSEQTISRVEKMFLFGTTTAEVKTGYGLNLETEIRLLESLLLVQKKLPIELVFTFLGAHAIPTEYKNDPGAYTVLIRSEMLPEVLEWWNIHASTQPLPFVDVFCEDGAFSLEQTRTILMDAKSMGFPLKIHVDEFKNLGGVPLAIELGATSADHLVETSRSDISAMGKSDVVAVALPCTPFGLGSTKYTPAKEFLDADCILAIATDLNPGTAWCESMQFAIALACRYMNLTPAQAIVCATINAAKAIERDHTIGSIEPGKQADIIILDVPHYQHLGYRFGTNLVHTIIKRGKVFSSKGLT